MVMDIDPLSHTDSSKRARVSPLLSSTSYTNDTTLYSTSPKNPLDDDVFMMSAGFFTQPNQYDYINTQHINPHTPPRQDRTLDNTFNNEYAHDTNLLTYQSIDQPIPQFRDLSNSTHNYTNLPSNQFNNDTNLSSHPLYYNFDGTPISFAQNSYSSVHTIDNRADTDSPLHSAVPHSRKRSYIPSTTRHNNASGSANMQVSPYTNTSTSPIMATLTRNASCQSSSINNELFDASITTQLNEFTLPHVQQANDDNVDLDSLPVLNEMTANAQQQHISYNNTNSTPINSSRRNDRVPVGGVVLTQESPLNYYSPKSSQPSMQRARSVQSSLSNNNHIQPNNTTPYNQHTNHSLSTCTDPNTCQSLDCVSHRVDQLDVNHSTSDKKSDSHNDRVATPLISAEPKKNKHLLKDRERRAKIKHGVDHLRSLLEVSADMKTDQSSVIHFACTYITQQNQTIAMLKAKLNNINSDDNTSKFDTNSTDSNNNDMNTGILSSTHINTTQLYRQMNDSNICMYRLSESTCSIIEVNTVVEHTTGFHSSVLLHKPMCSRPIGWHLYHLPTLSMINTYLQTGRVIKQEHVSTLPYTQPADVIHDITQLPINLRSSALSEYFPHACSEVSDQLKPTDSYTIHVAQLQAQYLTQTLTQLSSGQGIKLLCRQNTAMNECIESIVTLCLLGHSAQQAGCIVMLQQAQQRMVYNNK